MCSGIVRSAIVLASLTHHFPTTSQPELACGNQFDPAELSRTTHFLVRPSTAEPSSSMQVRARLRPRTQPQCPLLFPLPLHPPGPTPSAHLAQHSPVHTSTHPNRSMSFFSSPYVTTRPYSLSLKSFTFPTSSRIASSRRSRSAVRSNRGSSANESSSSESDNVGEGGALDIRDCYIAKSANLTS